MFVQTGRPCIVRGTTRRYVTLPCTTREVALPGTVRWTSADRFGVPFGLFGADDTHDITEFVRTAHEK